LNEIKTGGFTRGQSGRAASPMNKNTVLGAIALRMLEHLERIAQRAENIVRTLVYTQWQSFDEAANASFSSPTISWAFAMSFRVIALDQKRGA